MLYHHQWVSTMVCPHLVPRMVTFVTDCDRLRSADMLEHSLTQPCEVHRTWQPCQGWGGHGRLCYLPLSILLSLLANAAMPANTAAHILITIYRLGPKTGSSLPSVAAGQTQTSSVSTPNCKRRLASLNQRRKANKTYQQNEAAKAP